MFDGFRTADVSAGLVEFLLHALNCDAQECCLQTKDTLYAIGGDIVADLRHAAKQMAVSFWQNKRLTETLCDLAEHDGSSSNPIAGMFRVLLAVVATERDQEVTIRCVGMACGIVGRHIVARVLMDALCDQCHHNRYTVRLIGAVGSIRDALTTTHVEYLRQITRFAFDNDVKWQCEHLVQWVTNSPAGEFKPHAGFSDPVVAGLKLLEWLERSAVIGPDTAVREPEWLWMRRFRYQPTIVNRGPFVAMNP